MNQARFGFPSEIQDLTYQKNTDNDFEFNKTNFNHLIYEVLRLRRQRTEYLSELLELTRQSNKQKDIIIEMSTELNYDTGISPLKLVI